MCPASNDAPGRTGDAWQKVCSEASLRSRLTSVIMFSDRFVCDYGLSLWLRHVFKIVEPCQAAGSGGSHLKSLKLGISWAVGPEPQESLNELWNSETTSWAEPCP